MQQNPNLNCLSFYALWPFISGDTHKRRVSHFFLLLEEVGILTYLRSSVVKILKSRATLSTNSGETS